MPAVAAGAALSGLVAGSTAVFWATGGISFFAGFSVAAFAGSLVLGGLSYALTPKPKSPNLNALSNKGSTVAVRQPDLTRQLVYGHTRITRGFAHMQSTGLNGKLHIILILCEGPVRAINEVWMNDYSIPNDWIDSNGNVTQGRYAGKLVIRKHLGTETQGADSLAVANMASWSETSRLAGVAYMYLILEKDQDVYPNGVPNVSAIVEGREVYDPRVSGDNWSTNIALYANDFLSNERFGFGISNDDIDLTNVAAQANICDEMVETQPFSKEVVSVDDSLSLITLEGDLLTYQFGDRVQISSTVSVPDGLEEGTNYYVIPYQIKGTPRIGLAETLDDSMAKNYIEFESSGSGSMIIMKNAEPRYHGSGVIDSETPLSDTLNDIVSSMAGRAVAVGGFWTLLAGAWREPTLDLGIDDIRSSISFKNSLTMAESFNVVKGLYVSSETLYQSSDYPSVLYEQYVQEDNDILAIRELNLPFTNRPTTAQRISKIELFRGRQDIVFKTDFSTKGLQVQPGSTVNLNIDRLGWEDKVFEVTDFSLDTSVDGIITRMTLRETAQEIYDWTSGEAIDFDPAPNTNLPDPFNVQVPTGVSYNSRIIDTSQGDEVYNLTLQWDEHPDSFVTQFGDFEIQFKLSSSPDWRPSFFVQGSLTQTDIISASVNTFYDLRIRARNNLGVRSPWVTILNAVAGSSGGVGETEDWETFSDPVTEFKDWETFSDPVTSFEDWEYFT